MPTWDELRAQYGSDGNPKHQPKDEPDYDDDDSSDAYKRGYNSGYDDGFDAGEEEGKEDSSNGLQQEIDDLESTIRDLEESLIDVIRLALDGADYEKIITEASFYLPQDKIPKPVREIKLDPETVRTYWVRTKAQ
jgi:hypothetical protein